MKRFNHRLVIQNIFLSFAFSLTACKMIGFSVSTDDATDPNFKVAFIGDSGSGSDFRNVVRLIKKHGAHLACTRVISVTTQVPLTS